jgi:hypothetical protein
MGKRDYNLYHLKCIMAGAYGQIYEEIFRKHFYQTLLCLNCDGDRFEVAWIILICVKKRVNHVKLEILCIFSYQCSRNKICCRIPHRKMCKGSFVYHNALFKIIDFTIPCPCHRYFFISIFS